MGAAAAIAVAYVPARRARPHDGGIATAFRVTFALDPLVLAFLVAATLAAALAVRRAAGVAGHQDRHRRESQGPGPRRGRRRPDNCGPGRLLVACSSRCRCRSLFGAGLLARTVYNLQRADLGFPAERLLLVRVDLREAGYEPVRRDGLIRDLLGRDRSAFPAFVPRAIRSSVSSAAANRRARSTSRDTRRKATAIAIRRSTPSGRATSRRSACRCVLGRDILESDRAGSPAVCVINEAFAKRFFDRRNPIGLRVTIVGEDGGRVVPGRRRRRQRAAPRACAATSSRATSWRPHSPPRR